MLDHRPRIVNPGASCELAKPMPHFLGYRTKPRGEIQQLRPMWEQLTGEANRLQILV